MSPFAIANLKIADKYLAMHLGQQHPIRLQLKELIESLVKNNA